MWQMQGRRDFFSSLWSIDWNLSAAKIEGQVFLKGAQRKERGLEEQGGSDV